MNATKDVTITLRPLEPGVYAVSPYPFKEDGAEFAFSGRYVTPPARASERDFAAMLQATPRSWQRFTLLDQT